jgi:N-formylglutamate amidohydrolase
MNDIILHIPHSSKVIPQEYMGDYFDIIEKDETLLKLTDTFVDELFDLNNTPHIKFGYSRIFCDVERFVESEPMEKCGQGFYYTNGINLKPFRNDYNKIKVLNEFYLPHCKMVGEIIKKYNNPLIIDCHSFSDEIYPCTPFKTNDKLPDFILGHNNKNREIKLCNMLSEYLIGIGFNVIINKFYKGSYTIDNCDSIMIEINKRLYLLDDYLSKRADFYKMKYVIKTIIDKIKDKQ